MHRIGLPFDHVNIGGKPCVIPGVYALVALSAVNVHSRGGNTATISETKEATCELCVKGEDGSLLA